MSVAGLWRRKRRGKPFGSWHTTIDGLTLNLQTKDPTEALRRKRLAATGKWRPSTSRRDNHDRLDQEQEEADDAAAAATAAIRSPASPLSPEPSQSSLEGSPLDASPPPSRTGTPVPPAGASPPLPLPSAPTSSAPTPPAPPPAPPSSTSPSAEEAAHAAAAAAAEVAGDEPPAADELPGVDASELLDLAGVAISEGIKAGCAALARQRGYVVGAPPSDQAARLVAVGDRMTVEATKQTIVWLLPKLANVHPAWGVAAGMMCVALGQLVCLRPMTAEEVRAADAGDDLARRRDEAA